MMAPSGWVTAIHYQTAGRLDIESIWGSELTRGELSCKERKKTWALSLGSFPYGNGKAEKSCD